MMQSDSVLKRGIVAGLLGAGTVALWFFALDVAAGHPFRTPAALGHALLFGGDGFESFDTSFRVVAAYTVVHFLAFMLAGWVFALIASKLERRPSFVLLAVMTVIVLEAVAVVNLAQGAQWAGLGIWTVVVANLLAVAVMSAYVWRTHPMLLDKISMVEPNRVRV